MRNGLLVFTVVVVGMLVVVTEVRELLQLKAILAGQLDMAMPVEME